jgi:pyruvate-formate lyase-activating enzyme
VTAYKDTFCNAAWYELHIFWDGSLAYCCQQKDLPYSELAKDSYNIKTMTVAEWYNSAPMQQQRLMFSETTRNPACSDCWKQEEHSNTSRRHKANQKSVIFQKENFDASYKQSPGYEKFEHSFANKGHYDGLPIDLHIDLGNHCNLACKMCWGGASSKIAAQEIKWGEEANKKTLVNWTQDDIVWDRFVNELLEIPNLKNIHLMGGETMLSPRFKDLVARFDECNRHEVCFSFVTNGTVWDRDLIEKLSRFARVGIEVSMETLGKQNEYIRQGTNNREVLSNIEKFKQYANDSNITITIRPALGLLSLGYYYSLIEYCLQNQLVIKSLPMTRPAHLVSSVMPRSIRQTYKQRYLDLIEQYNLHFDLNVDYNESDWHNYKQIALSEIHKALYEIDLPEIENQDSLLGELVFQMKRWDQVYGFDMQEYYPELTEILTKHGY